VSFQESRKPWRKLWRKEPALRQAGLSYHARTLAVFLLRHADDTGCLGPVSESGHAAAHLAQMLAVPSRNRKAFYRELDELLEHGDDGEQLALVIRDGHFFLTRFEECQANRRAKTGTQPGQERDKSGTRQGPSLAANYAEPLKAETDLATEVRSKKREVRKLIGSDANRERRAGDATLVANRPAGSEPGSLAKSMYAKFFEERYGKARTNLDRYGKHFEQIGEHARRQPGNVGQVLQYVYRRFFADDSQVEYGQHSPATLAGKGFFRHISGYAEEHEAERRVQLEREHSDKVHAKLEADTAQWRRERAEAEHMQKVRGRAPRREQNGQGPMADVAAELARSVGEGKL
jgi:hypothetical protein